MAKALSKAATEFRDRAERHRVLASLYDRLGAQQELADNLEHYGTKLEDVRADMVRLAKTIAELERAAPGEIIVAAAVEV